MRSSTCDRHVRVLLSGIFPTTITANKEPASSDDEGGRTRGRFDEIPNKQWAGPRTPVMSAQVLGYFSVLPPDFSLSGSPGRALVPEPGSGLRCCRGNYRDRGAY